MRRAESWTVVLWGVGVVGVVGTRGSGRLLRGRGRGTAWHKITACKYSRRVTACTLGAVLPTGLAGHRQGSIKTRSPGSVSG